MSWTELCAAFRWSFARVVPDDPEDQRHFPVHYLGVWDTVASVGWAWDPVKYPFTARNPSVRHVRHGLAIDERRWFFRENRMYPAEGQRFEQRWFPGVHSDIGGGYPVQDGGLWRGPFEWLIDGALSAGLRLDPARREKVAPSPPPQTTCLERKHESLVGSWWLAEYFPKQRWSPERRREEWAVGAGRYRSIRPGDLLDEGALIRLRDDPTYRPKNLDPRFVSFVRALPVVTGPLPYAPAAPATAEVAV